MASAKRRRSRFPNHPASNFLVAATYAVYDGVEVRLDRKGQGWELWTNERTVGFTRDEYGRYVRRIAVGDPLELECFRLEYHANYRGITLAVQSPEGPVMAWTSDSRSLAEGFMQADRGEYRKSIPLDDPDLHISISRIPLPVPWAPRPKPSDDGTPSWNDFRDRLVDTFRKTSERLILIIASDVDPKKYVQFAREADRLDAEAPAADVVADATESVLTEAGWMRPGIAQPNWTSSLAFPALTTEYRAFAECCVAALRDACGVANPGELHYRAWREAQQMSEGETWSAEKVERMDRGAPLVELPSLGLRRAGPSQK